MKLSTAVLLCGGQTSLLSPLVRYTPVCMLPVFNKPLIERTIDSLIGQGFGKIIVATSKENAKVAEFVNGLSRHGGKTAIECYQEDKPRGTAGVLRDLRAHFGDESFLVLNGNIFLSGVNFADMAACHYERGSAITIGVKRSERQPVGKDGISVEDGGAVNGFSVFHASRDRRSSYNSPGLYVFSPIALDFITDKGFFDIKEQLIPALKQVALPLHACEIRGGYRAVNSLEDYFDLHREQLFNGDMPHGGMREIAEGVWVSDGVDISPSAYIVGPAVIGRNTKIAGNTEIIGPIVIGDNCAIGENLKIRESIIWDDVVIEGKSKLRYCIAVSGLRINSAGVSNKILIDNLVSSDLNFAHSGHEFNGVVETALFKMSRVRHFFFLGAKRIIDTLASLILLALFAPVLLLIAIAIKIDSHGPVVFCQKRCGKDGVDFMMFKFRTMSKDADAMQQKLMAQKSVDGPMFKLHKDPRVTRIGSFLRKTSLDELPQLVNVLKGEMSLVGPRPLVMDEMKFSPSWRSIRLKAKPGITGLWQVQGRSEASFHDWISYDIFYVKNQSLFLDLKILLKTVTVVLRKVGAY